MEAPSITCPRCGRTSWHLGDIENLYCGGCHWWTSDPILGAPDVIAEAEAKGRLSVISPAPALVMQDGRMYWSDQHVSRSVEVALIVGLVLGLAIAGIAALLYAAGL